MVQGILLHFRNFIWGIRRWWKHDAFERERGAWTCGTVQETVCSMRDILKYWGFEIDHLLQFEDEGQVLSGRKVFDNGRRQYHLRFFPSNSGLEVRAHSEYTYEYNPIRHLKGEGCESACEMFWELYHHTKEVMT